MFISIGEMLFRSFPAVTVLTYRLSFLQQQNFYATFAVSTVSAFVAAATGFERRRCIWNALSKLFLNFFHLRQKFWQCCNDWMKRTKPAFHMGHVLSCGWHILIKTYEETRGFMSQQRGRKSRLDKNGCDACSKLWYNKICLKQNLLNIGADQRLITTSDWIKDDDLRAARSWSECKRAVLGEEGIFRPPEFVSVSRKYKYDYFRKNVKLWRKTDKNAWNMRNEELAAVLV